MDIFFLEQRKKQSELTTALVIMHSVEAGVAAWRITPKIAEETFRTMMKDEHVLLEESVGIITQCIVHDPMMGNMTILTSTKRYFHGKRWIDASYDGDLVRGPVCEVSWLQNAVKQDSLRETSSVGSPLSTQ